MLKRKNPYGPTAADFHLKRTADLSPVYEHLFKNPTTKPDYKILKPNKKNRNELVRARYRLIFDSGRYRKAFRRRESTDSVSPTPSESSQNGEDASKAWNRRLLKLIPEGTTLPEKASKWKSLEDYAREHEETQAA